MAPAVELERVTANVMIWRAYDSSVKADLFSTAILSPHGNFVIDPIPLTEPALRNLRQIGELAGIIVTNSNHQRASSQFAERFSAPLFAHSDSFPNEKPLKYNELADGDQLGPALTAIALDGAAPGEIALYHSPNGGTLIVGDALINFEPYGFTFLPGKYCSDEKEMRRSLLKLVDREAERIFFAHGLPITSNATARLRRLLDVNAKDAE
jgi:glyoxylase-like metal-dependent hydrolase (beta-lactamase superfamily II)